MQSRSNGMWWGIAVEAPEPRELATFYSQLLGWPIGAADNGSVILPAPEGPIFLVLQPADDFEPPTWPPVKGSQRPMMHLDFQVSDLDSAVAEAVALGATVADEQPNSTVRVLFDPAGHPFCLSSNE